MQHRGQAPLFHLGDRREIDLAIDDHEGATTVELQGILLAEHVLLARDGDRGGSAQRDREGHRRVEVGLVTDVENLDCPLGARAIPHEVQVTTGTRRHRQAGRDVAGEGDCLVATEWGCIRSVDRQLHRVAGQQHEDAIHVRDLREGTVTREVGHR